MLRVTWIAALLAACGGRAPAAATVQPAASRTAAAVVPPAAAVDTAALEQDLPRLAERALAMYGDIARALAGEDCAAVAVRLRELSPRYRDVALASARVVRNGRARELRAALDTHGDELDAAAQAVVQAPAMARCAPDPAFGRAFDELTDPADAAR